MQQAQHTDKRQEALLCALKPYLAPERQAKIDEAHAAMDELEMAWLEASEKLEGEE